MGTGSGREKSSDDSSALGPGEETSGTARGEDGGGERARGDVGIEVTAKL
jgi:hypothetical protein